MINVNKEFICKRKIGRSFELSARIKTGKVVKMQESCGEGSANHIGLESCAVSGDAGAEVLTEGRKKKGVTH